jgi:hypothetical protein
VEARVQDLLEAVNKDPLERITPCDLQKLIESLKLRKAFKICYQTHTSRNVDGLLPQAS